MAQAHLIHRGEQFEVVDGNARFEGECLWSWEEVPDASPRRVYPLSIVVQSIRRRGSNGSPGLAGAEQLRIAKLAKLALEARESGCEVLLMANG
jgi:hypothetical protein